MPRSRLQNEGQSLIDAVCSHLREAGIARVAMRCEGILEATWYYWRDKGRNDVASGIDSIYARFHKAVIEAQAVFERRQVEFISNHSDWKARQYALSIVDNGVYGQSKAERREQEATSLTPEEAVEAMRKERTLLANERRELEEERARLQEQRRARAEEDFDPDEDDLMADRDLPTNHGRP